MSGAPIDVAALQQRLRSQGVTRLLAQFTDMHGVAKGKYLPLDQLPLLLATGAGFAGPSIWGTGLPRTGPRSEFYARGDATSAMPLPWLPDTARLVCSGFVDGEPFDACPRQVAQRAAARLARRGWHLQTGIEPEFFLLKEDAGRWRPADPIDTLDKPSYDLQSLHRRERFLADMQAALTGCGLEVLQLDHEDAHGQYEINFSHAEAVRSADHLMLCKLAAHAIAERHGAVFSMMPKPWADQPGSGMHFHVSLWAGTGAGEASRNLFAPEADAPASATLSRTGRQFIAGVLAHARALTALGAPTLNSYKRLVVGPSRSGTSWAPAVVAHGPNNRTTPLRTLPGRFEWRLPDSAANPYLVTAGLIAAGLDGIDRGLDPGPDCTDDLFTLPAAALAERGYPALPRHLGEALDALADDAVIGEALGATLLAQFIALKRDEIAEHARHVSDWEYQRYARTF